MSTSKITKFNLNSDQMIFFSKFWFLEVHFLVFEKKYFLWQWTAMLAFQKALFMTNCIEKISPKRFGFMIFFSQNFEFLLYFTMKTRNKSLCQKYLKKSKLWNFFSFPQNSKIHLFCLVDIGCWCQCQPLTSTAAFFSVDSRQPFSSCPFLTSYHDS